MICLENMSTKSFIAYKINIIACARVLQLPFIRMSELGEINSQQLWTDAVKNTHSDVSLWLAQLCGALFIEESFEEQSVIAKSLGWNILKPNAVPAIFKNGNPPTKKLKRHNKNISQDAGDIPSKHAQNPLQAYLFITDL